MTEFWNWINTHNWFTTTIIGVLMFALGHYLSGSQKAQEDRPILYTDVEVTNCVKGELNIAVKTENHGKNVAWKVTGMTYLLDRPNNKLMRRQFEYHSYVPKGKSFTHHIACTRISNPLYIVQVVEYQDMITRNRYNDDYKAYRIFVLDNRIVSALPEQEDIEYIDSYLSKIGFKGRELQQVELILSATIKQTT